MAEITENGLCMRWTNTVQDASRQGQRVLVEAGPISPANVLKVIYSVDGGPERLVRGWCVGKDPETGMQAFAADLPAVPAGQSLRWRPVLTQGTRVVDPGPRADAPEERGIVPLPETSVPKQAAEAEDVSKPLFPLHLEYLFRIFAPFDHKTYSLGKTPDGMPMRFSLVAGGVVRGPAMNGEILDAGGDWMRVREDGIGVVDVHALIRPDTGGMLMTYYSGIADFGPDGFARMQAGNPPDIVPVRLTPQYLTSDAKWAWLNRVQCIAIGEVNMPNRMLQYDEYVMCSKVGGSI